MHIILGLIMMVVGFLIVIKSEWMLNNFGRIGFFDQHLGAEGGTRLGYKLIGILVIFLGFLVLTGMIRDLLMWIFSPMIRFQGK